MAILISMYIDRYCNTFYVEINMWKIKPPFIFLKSYKPGSKLPGTIFDAYHAMSFVFGRIAPRIVSASQTETLVPGIRNERNIGQLLDIKQWKYKYNSLKISQWYEADQLKITTIDKKGFFYYSCVSIQNQISIILTYMWSLISHLSIWVFLDTFINLRIFTSVTSF